MSEKIRLQPVLITWADAHAHEGSWVYINDIEDTGEYLVTSVGWLLPPGEGGFSNHASIAQSHGPDNAIDHIIHIPTGMIRSVQYLEPMSQKIHLSLDLDTPHL